MEVRVNASENALSSLSLFASLRGRKRPYENRDQLIALIEQAGQPRFRQQLGTGSQLEPTLGFAELLQTDTEFVDEIPLAFSAPGFGIVGSARRASADELPCDVPAEARVRKRVYDFANSGRKLDQPL